MSRERILEEARARWESLADLRERRNRYKRFTYGRQWDDAITDPHSGQKVTERSLLSKDGRPPLTNNLIRQLVKTIIGRFRMGRGEAERGALDRVYVLNELDELDSRLLEEFLISSIAVQRVCREVRDDGLFLPRVENVSPERMFFNVPKDPRGIDIDIIGTLHDMKPEEVAIRWGGSKRATARRILFRCQRLIADNAKRGVSHWDSITDFYSADGNYVRVVEVWKREAFEQLKVHDPENGTITLMDPSEEANIETENILRKRDRRPELTARWEMVRQWVGRWFLSDGTLLSKMTAPAGVSHPFIVKLYPLIDGEIHSLVEDVIDQQKYINRLINLLDRMMATAAKGALLFPVDALPEGCEFEDIANQWAATDGVVIYKSNIGDEAPKQVTTTVGDIGAKDLLKTEMQLFKEISGVSDTLTGRNLSGSMGVERYNLELQSATTSIRDLLESFSCFLAQRDLRLLQLGCDV